MNEWLLILTILGTPADEARVGLVTEIGFNSEQACLNAEDEYLQRNERAVDEGYIVSTVCVKRSGVTLDVQ